MKQLFILTKKIVQSVPGFVLPYTLFLCAIMILVTSSVSSTLVKQIYFSRLARQSQAAYYAADNAILCAIAIDSTYIESLTGIGIFPYNALSSTPMDDLQNVLNDTTIRRSTQELSSLAPSLTEIKCAGSLVFDTGESVSKFSVDDTPFMRLYEDEFGVLSSESGRTSRFKMKFDMGDGTSRCAKVTINKTPSYRQIIAQGYALCNNYSNITNSVERAVVNTTISH